MDVRLVENVRSRLKLPCVVKERCFVKRNSAHTSPSSSLFVMHLARPTMHSAQNG